MDSLPFISEFITAIITDIVTFAGSFLFYKQEKKSRDIDNESRQSDEWRKLYLESQEDSRKKDQKIDDLYREIAEMRRHMNALERKVNLNSIYRCEHLKCANRIPPLTSVDPDLQHRASVLNDSDRSHSRLTAEQSPSPSEAYYAEHAIDTPD